MSEGCQLPILAQDQATKRYCGKRPVRTVRVGKDARGIAQLCDEHRTRVLLVGWAAAVEEASGG